MAGRKIAGWLSAWLLAILMAISPVTSDPQLPSPPSDGVQQWAAADGPEVAAIKPEVDSAIETGRQINATTVPSLQQQQQQQQQRRQRSTIRNSLCLDGVQCTTPVNALSIFSPDPPTPPTPHAISTQIPATAVSTHRICRKGGVFGCWLYIPNVSDRVREDLQQRGFAVDGSSQLVEDGGRSPMTTPQSITVSSSRLSLLSLQTFASSVFESLGKNVFPGKQFDHNVPSRDQGHVSISVSTSSFGGVTQHTGTQAATSIIATSEERARVKTLVQESLETVVSGSPFRVGKDSNQKGRRRRSAEDETQSSATSTSSTSALSTSSQSSGESLLRSTHTSPSLQLPLGLDNVTFGDCGRGGNWSCRGRCGHAPSLPCSCDALCQLTGHCCEDFHTECPFSASPALASYSGRRLQCTKGYMLVSDCSPDWAGTEAETLCQKEKHDVIDDVAPVSSVATGVAFANMHCARCNNVSAVQEWLVVGDCVIGSMDFAELHKWCRFSYLPPEELPGQRCTRGGLYPYYDSCPQGTPLNQQVACQLFHSYVRTEIVRGDEIIFRTFKNVHCLECWLQAFPDEICLEDGEILLSLTNFHTGNFLVLMKWSLGSGSEMEVSQRMQGGNVMTWKNTCNSLGECTLDMCKTNSIRTPQGCTEVPFLAFIRLYLNNKNYLIQVQDEVLAHFKQTIKLIPEAVHFCNTSFSPTEFDSGVGVVFECGEGFSDIGEYERTTMITDLAEKTFLSLSGEVQSLVETICTKWSLRGIEDTLCSKPPVAGSKLADTQDMEVSAFLRAERVVSLTGSSLSVVALSVRVALQWWVPTFRSVPAKLQLCLACCLLVAYLGFLSGAEVSEGTWGCWGVAVLTDAAFLASFLWMNVFLFLLWRSLAELRATHSATCRTLLSAAAYCVSVCAVLVGAAVTVDLAFPHHALSPRFARPGCWFNGGLGLLVFFAAPSLLVCAVNAVLVLLTLRLICQNRMSRRDDNGARQKAEVGVAVRLATLTGVTWLVGLAASLADKEGLWMTFTVLNSLMGLGVGLNLVFTRRNLRFFRQKFQSAMSSSEPMETRSTT